MMTVDAKAVRFLVISGIGYLRLEIFGYLGTRKQFCKNT